MNKPKRYFEAEPFYNPVHENTIPEKDEIVRYFTKDLFPYWDALRKRVKMAYDLRQKNLKVALSGKGRIIETEDTKNYDNIHNESIIWSDYYNILLTVVKNKHGIWLNDYLK